jgi:hypothetical protein
MPGLRIDFSAYDTNPKYRSWVNEMARPYNINVNEYRSNQKYRGWVDSQWQGAQSAPVAPEPAPPSTPAPAPAPPEERGDLSNLGRGIAAGLSKAGTSLIGGVGYLGEKLGAEDNALQRFARETEAEAQAFYDPQGKAGQVGKFLGYGAGSIATGVTGAGVAGRLIGGVAPKAAAALRGAAPMPQRILAQTAVNAPIDIAQGLGEQEGGVLLPGRAGAALENVAFSALGGALPVRQGAKAVRGPKAALKEGVETTGRNLEEQVKRIARADEIPANVTPEDYVNVARLSDDPDVQARLLRATQRAVEETDLPGRLPARPGEKLGRLETPEAFEEVRRRVAGDLGISPAEVIARTQKGERIGRDDMLRVRTALMQAASEENELLKRIQAGAFDTAEEAATAGVLKQRLRNEINGLINVVTKQGTETARDLAAMRIGALQTGDPAVWIGRLQELAKRTLSDAERMSIYKAAEAKDFDTLMRLGRDVQKSTTGEKIAAFFRANLLTNPKTHAINVTGNVGMRLLETAKDVPATLFDALIGSATGVRTKDLSLADLATGGFRGAKKGFADAVDVLRRGDVDTKTLEIPKQVNFDSPLANAYVNGVFRSLAAEDKFFRTIAYTRSLEEQARVAAKARGLKGRALVDEVQTMVRKPSAQMEAQAILDADIVTFRQDSKLAGAASGMRNAIAKVTGETAANILIPFARTPANIAATIINYSPLGAIEPLIKRKAIGQKQLAEALGRSSVGTLAIFTGYQMAKDGAMTGFYPTDDKTRKEWELTGRTEGSLRVGNNWVQVNRLSPMGNLMTIGAALHQLEQEDPGVGQTILRSAAMPASAVYDLPMVSGVRDLIEAIRPGGEGAEAFARGTARAAQGFIPGASLIRGVARGMDTTTRETRTGEGPSIARSTAAGIPGVAQGLPERLTALGEPVRRAESRMGSMVESLLSPVSISPARTATDPLLREIERTRAVPTPLAQRKGESDEAFQNRQRLTGTAIRRVLESVTQDQRYQAVQQMDPMALRQALAALRIDTNQMDDAEVRTRYQRYILDRAIQSAKSGVGRGFPSPRPEVTVP